MEILDANAEVQENPSRDTVERQSMEHDILQQTRPQDVHILSEIGRVMLAIWITHWNCIKQQREWSDQAAFNMYESIIPPTNDRFL
jgi:hypothetical protein